jgi:hypothetical protein
VGLGAAEIVVGFSGRTRAADADRDDPAVGRARYYGPSVVVRRVDGLADEASYVATLVHELGHVLGAWHSNDATSFMHPGGAGRVRFDTQSLNAIAAMRDLDFAKGVDGIDDDRKRYLAGVYRDGHLPGEPLPFVEEEIRRAERLRLDGHVLEGRRIAERTLAEQHAAGGTDDGTLLPCLRELARSYLDGTEYDLAEARRIVRRALGVRGKESPLLASRLILAEIDARRGELGVAADDADMVYSIRRSVLGETNPQTVYAKKLLDDCRARAAARLAPK